MSQENRIIWLDGKLLPLDKALINVLTPSNQFGANVFEGIRCYYNTKRNILYGFRLKEHYKRLLNSVKLFKFEEKYTEKFFLDALVAVVNSNHYKEDIAVRQTVFLDGQVNWAARGPINMFVAPIAKARLEMPSTCTVHVTSFERIHEKNMSPRIKVGANYINSRYGQIEAIECGYDTALFLNRDGKVSEGPGSGFVIVKDGCLISPPTTESILESITRDTIFTLAKEELNLKTIERPIDRTEIYLADEAFFCGSAVEINAAVKIDGAVIGSGRAGIISTKLHKLYIEAASGEMPKYKDWLTEIH